MAKKKIEVTFHNSATELIKRLDEVALKEKNNFPASITDPFVFCYSKRRIMFIQELWQFLKSKIVYDRLDGPKDNVKAPNIVWADKRANYYSYILFIASFLKACNINFEYVLVRLNPGKDFQHVYFLFPDTDETLDITLTAPGIEGGPVIERLILKPI